MKIKAKGNVVGVGTSGNNNIIVGGDYYKDIQYLTLINKSLLQDSINKIEITMIKRSQPLVDSAQFIENSGDRGRGYVIRSI